MPHRLERINSAIRQEISDLLTRQVKDPRMGNFISITQVFTTPDLKYARIYISSLGDEHERKNAIKALNAAAGYFRFELSKRMKLRYTPELTFVWDSSIEHGEQISQLIDKLTPPAETPPEPNEKA